MIWCIHKIFFDFTKFSYYPWGGTFKINSNVLSPSAFSVHCSLCIRAEGASVLQCGLLRMPQSFSRDTTIWGTKRVVDLIDVLEGVNMSLSALGKFTDALSGEKYSSVSLVKPILHLFDSSIIKKTGGYTTFQNYQTKHTGVSQRQIQWPRNTRDSWHSLCLRPKIEV